jgi:hypothetical protein
MHAQVAGRHRLGRGSSLGSGRLTGLARGVTLPGSSGDPAPFDQRVHRGPGSCSGGMPGGGLWLRKIRTLGVVENLWRDGGEIVDSGDMSADMPADAK